MAIEFFTLRSSLFPYKGASLFYLFTFLPLKVPFNHLHPRRQPHLSVVDNELQAGAVGETGGVKTKRK